MQQAVPNTTQQHMPMPQQPLPQFQMYQPPAQSQQPQVQPQPAAAQQQHPPAHPPQQSAQIFMPGQGLMEQQQLYNQFAKMTAPYQRPQQNTYPKAKAVTHTLHIGNLPKNFYQLDLHKFFKSKGYKLQGAKVATDRNTQKPLRYGFLTFLKKDEAEKCQREMNNADCFGQQLRVSMNLDQKERDPTANIIVRNLAPTVSQQSVYDNFIQFGQVLSCKLEVFPDQTSRGFCYVQFDSAESAKKALDANQTMEIDGKKLEIFQHKAREERQKEVDNSIKFSNLYVQGLPKETNEEELKSMFEKYGTVNSVKVVDKSEKDATTNVGYVCFDQAQAAQAAMEALNKKEIGEGHYLLVNHHVTKRDNELQKAAPLEQIMKQTFNSNLFVKNVPKDITEEELRKLFEQCGPIISIKLRMSNKGQFLGNPAYHQYFVLYEDVESAKKAIRKWDQSTELGGKPLTVEFWVSKQDLMAEREQRGRQQVINWLQQQQNDSYPPHSQHANQGHNFHHNQQHQSRYQGGDQNKFQGQRHHGGGQNYRGQQRGGRGGGGQRHGGNTHQQTQQQQQQQAVNPIPQVVVPLPAVDVSSIFATQDPIARKQQVGNALYHCIASVLEDKAGKITGMLLDDGVKINYEQLLSDQNFLNQNVRDALNLLRNADQQQQLQQTQQEPVRGEQPATQQ